MCQELIDKYQQPRFLDEGRRLPKEYLEKIAEGWKERVKTKGVEKKKKVSEQTKKFLAKKPKKELE